MHLVCSSQHAMHPDTLNNLTANTRMIAGNIAYTQIARLWTTCFREESILHSKATQSDILVSGSTRLLPIHAKPSLFQPANWLDKIMSGILFGLNRFVRSNSPQKKRNE